MSFEILSSLMLTSDFIKERTPVKPINFEQIIFNFWRFVRKICRRSPSMCRPSLKRNT